VFVFKEYGGEDETEDKPISLDYSEGPADVEGGN
jgi:hypothetical protein